MSAISHLEVPGVWVTRFDVEHKFSNLGLVTHIAAELVKSDTCLVALAKWYNWVDTFE